MTASKDLLIIFTRNPELGKCKTRLAATVGNKTALEIYEFLLEHTVGITRKIDPDKVVYYSEAIWENDIWSNAVYDKKLQEGDDLGEKMLNAFNEGFNAGYEHIIIIGSDLYDLTEKDLIHAFGRLRENDFVLGPAKDGGYYLLGMNRPKISLFQNKDWGKSTVLAATLSNLEDEKYALLDVRNDVDIYEDIKDNKAFLPFLKHLKND